MIERGRSFKSLFGRAEASFEGEAQEESAREAEEKEGIVPEVATTREEISGLLDKVRSLTRDFRGVQR